MEKWYVIFLNTEQCKYIKDAQKWHSQWKSWNFPKTVGQKMERGSFREMNCMIQCCHASLAH